MTKLFRIVVAFTAAHLQAGPVTTSEPPVTRAWAILDQGVTNTSAAKRANAIHALRLLPDETRARSMAENALADARAFRVCGMDSRESPSALPVRRSASGLAGSTWANSNQLFCSGQAAFPLSSGLCSAEIATSRPFASPYSLLSVAVEFRARCGALSGNWI
jgi:hypothetical protein